MKMEKLGKILIGTSGYHYKHWENGVFYPKNLKREERLKYYATFFDTVELNVTFYRLPSEKAFKSWKEMTPYDFKFSIKGSRFITHIKRLRDVSASLSLFFERAKPLFEKISVILWQFPKNFRCDLKRLLDFLSELEMLCDFRHAFEFRNLSWFNPHVKKALDERKMAICEADSPFSNIEIKTDSPFVYIRRHGSKGLYNGCYSIEDLKRDASYIVSLAKNGKDVYVYFNNDIHGYAIKNGITLKELVKELL